MLIAFRALIRRDIKLFLNDKRAVPMSVIAPILLASFFGYTLGGGRSGKPEMSRISIAVTDADASAISRAIVTRLAGDKALDVKPLGRDEARALVQKGKISAAIGIPQGFGAAAGKAFFGPAQKPEIEILYDPSRGPELSMVQSMLTGHVMQAVSKEMFTGATGRDTVKQSIAQVEQSPLAPAGKKRLLDLLRSVENLNPTSTSGGASGVMAGSMNVPYQVREEAVTSSQGVAYNAYGHAFAGMCVQFILFIGVEVGVGLLLQRQRGLWKRLRAAPLSRGVLLGSRIVSAAIIAFVDLQVIFTFARLAFGVHVEGSRAGFLGVCAAFSLMTAAYGLLIAAIGKTPEATRGLSILTTLLLVMLSGAWIPSFVFPAWLQKVTLAIPTRWAVDGLDAMTWRGLGFAAAAGPIAVLLGYAIVFGGLAVMRFRWEEN